MWDELRAEFNTWVQPNYQCSTPWMWYSKLCDFCFSVFDSFCAGFPCFRWWRNMERCMDRHASVSCWVWIKLLWISAQRLRRARDLYKRLPCELQHCEPVFPIYHIYFTSQTRFCSAKQPNQFICRDWKKYFSVCQMMAAAFNTKKKNQINNSDVFTASD